MLPLVNFYAVWLLFAIQPPAAIAMDHDQSRGLSLNDLGWSTPPDSPQPWQDQQSTSGSGFLRPSSHPQARASDFSSAPQQLEVIDYEILRSLAADLPDQSQYPDHSVDVRADAMSVPDQQGSTPSSESTAMQSNSPEKMTADDKKTRYEHTRDTIKWPEPQSFKSFRFLDPLKGEHKVSHLEFKINAAVRDDIGLRVFGGKLNWADKHVSSRLSNEDYRRRSPFEQTSRVLPLISPSDMEGTLVRIHMTQHNVPPRGRKLIGTPLEQRPYYMFWGVAESSVAKPLLIAHYGTGYIENEDVTAIDAHLRSLLDLTQHGRAGV